MKYAFVFLFFVFAQASHAQKHEFGLSLGGTNYKGDFTNDNFEIKNYRPGGLLFYKNNITPAFGMRYQLMIGGIGAKDAKSSDPVYVERGLSFNNIIYEGSMQLEYNFLNYRSTSNRIKWTPYFLAGLGIFYFSPYSNSSVVPIQPCIPIGAGIRFIVKEHLNLAFEFAARKTFTDMLDNTGGSTLGGNSDTQDWYLYNGVILSYTLYDIYCPRPKR